MTAYIIPIIFITVLLVSLFTKQDAYGTFTRGASGAIELMVNVFPYLLTIMMAVEVFRQSGVAAALANFVSPVMKFVGIPPELTELMLIRPLSGAGALGVLQNIFTTYGADTYIGRCASMIYGSSETIFYISAIYFSKTNIKKLAYAIPIALCSTTLGCIIGCLCCRII